MKNTIYLVTSGEYSDYGVVCAFDSEEKAKDFINLFTNDNTLYFSDELSIEPCLFNSFSREIKNGYKYYEVAMDIDFNLIEVRLSKYSNFYDKKIRLGYKGYLYAGIFAKDEKHAVKIMSERVMIYKAATV